MPLSAGLLLFRTGLTGFEFLLVHPGGPFFARKDEGTWSIPKGIVEPGEDPLASAKREFREETGAHPPEGDYIPLGEVRQKSGKRVIAWGVRGDFDPSVLCSNTFELEWPPRSGRRQSFPEVDRAQWFDLRGAQGKLNPAQLPLLERVMGAAGDATLARGG
jgi:predicted NUDIX family NTP pyrophosphohydrolase